MGYSKKELKFYIKYLKKSLKIINKINKWKWNPIMIHSNQITELEEQLTYYKDQLQRS